MRVLIIEDNPDGAEMRRALLEQWGHEVRVATDGPLGVEMATAWSPDVILVDIGLPGLDGYEVAQRLRRTDSTRHAWLLATTGYGRNEDRARAMAAGFDAHMVKPLDPPALKAAIASGPSRGRPQPERGMRAS